MFEKLNVSCKNCFTVEFEQRQKLVVVAKEKHTAQCWVRGLSLLSTDKSEQYKTVQFDYELVTTQELFLSTYGKHSVVCAINSVFVY